MSPAVVGWYCTATTCESAQVFRGISLSQKSIPLCDHTRCLAGAFDNLLWAVPGMTMTLTKINRNSVSLAGEFAALSQLTLRGYDADMTLVGRTKSVDILVSNPATLPSVAMAARNRARRIPHHIARNDGNRVRLYSRPGNDLTYRFPLIVETLARLRSRSCIIDGEAMHAVILV
jgi:hypothetical protein